MVGWGNELKLMRVALAVPMKNLREAGYLRAEDRRDYLPAFPPCVAIEQADRKAAAHFPVPVAADIIMSFVEVVAADQVHIPSGCTEGDVLSGPREGTVQRNVIQASGE